MTINPENIFKRLENILSSMNRSTGPDDVKEFAECSSLLLGNLLCIKDMIEIHTSQDILPGTLESIYFMNYIITEWILPNDSLVKRLSKKPLNTPHYEMMCKKWFRLADDEQWQNIDLKWFAIDRKRTIKSQCVRHLRSLILLHLVLGQAFRDCLRYR